MAKVRPLRSPERARRVIWVTLTKPEEDNVCVVVCGMASETENSIPACPPLPETAGERTVYRKLSKGREVNGDGCEHTAGDKRLQCRTETGPVEGAPESLKYGKYNVTGPTGPMANGECNGVGKKVAVAVASPVSVTLEEILKTFNAPISEDQAWALIYQASRMYKARLEEPGSRLRDLRLPLHPHQLHVQKDGSCIVTARTEFPED
uniref:KIND domain-containing protein n=1 Tax=Anopheles maculatus TaxID=74869 RepID=A0A182SZ55_9DIPT